MTKRNVGGMLLGLIVSVTAAIASCSFPSYEIIVTGTAGSTGGASATSSSGSAGGGGEGSASTTGSTSSGAGGSGGSASTSSASSTGTGVVCMGDGGACDCDDDKSIAATCEMGTDCNDNNPLVHPGQKTFFKDKIAGTTSDYDYDCNGKEDYEITFVIDCSNGLNCNTTAVGWKGAVPACGQSGQFGTCKVTGLAACGESIQGTQVQRCH